jgi:hypothetical protein
MFLGEVTTTPVKTSIVQKTKDKLMGTINTKNAKILTFAETELSKNIKKINLQDVVQMGYGLITNGDWSPINSKLLTPTVNATVKNGIEEYKPYLITAGLGILSVGMLLGGTIIYFIKR